MIDTSNAYKAFVYNKAPYTMDARHFLPEALVKVIDVAARSAGIYSASSSAFMTDFEQLVDEATQNDVKWGTLEDFQFLFSSDALLMASQAEVLSRTPHRGWMSEVMSDAEGNFAGSACQLICAYPEQVSTVGRVLYFDPAYDFVPTDFDLIYSRTGTEIARDEIRGNESYEVSSLVGVTRYDQLTIRFYKTSKPYRRIRLLEDIPGIYLTYSGSDITSMSVTQSVDIFSEELTVGEIELAIQNVTKSLDILNSEGLEKYLQRRQPIEVKLNLVFPDDSVESVLLGYWELAAWKSNKGALEATFTVRDPIDKLTQGEYIKGTLPANTTTMYDLAVEVLEDAGITNYTVDIELMNIYCRACLPIADHKELLRMIAQASQAVVIPTPEGGIHVKYASPLVYGYNCLEDGAFDDTEETPWALVSAEFTEDYIYTGSHSIKFTSTASSISQSYTGTAGHVYYARFYALPTETLAGLSGVAGFYANNTLVTVNIQAANLTPEMWTLVSGYFVADADTLECSLQSTLPAGVVYIDGMMLIDLTLIYGAGNEPAQDWCDTNIRFIVDTMLVPRAVDPAPVDTLDYSILIDAPEIELRDPVKSVETNIYSYETAAETSEVYKGTRVISGTEEFNVKYNSLAKNCTVTVNAVDDNGDVIEDSTVVLLESTFYSRAATFKVRANCNVQIIVTGNKVTASTSTYKVSSDIAPSLLADAVEKVIDNELITYKVVAEDVTSYAVYWYGRRYLYDFDWRQNPAVELLDTVTVHDDFGNNNGVLLTDRDLDYNGILSGNSKGVF